MRRTAIRIVLATGLSAAFVSAVLAAVPACSLAGLAGGPAASTSSGSGQGSGGGGGSAPLAYEAEKAALYGGFVVGDDPTASGGEYVYVPAGMGCSGGLSEVSFDIGVNAAANYMIWASVEADSGVHDSFFVSVDGANEAVFTLPRDGRFTEEVVSDSSAEVKAPTVYALTPGRHTVAFKCREDGASLDRIRLAVAPP